MGAAEGLASLREVVAQYDIENIYNADDFGLFYNMAPDRTISMHQLASRKQEKTKLTILAWCSANGTREVPIMFIEKSKKPHCFNKKNAEKIDFDYHFIEKAWMTSVLFFGWLSRFNDFIEKDVERSCLLQVENCSGHGTAENIPHIPFGHVEFWPPNTTSEVRACDVRIITALKVGFRRLHMERVLDLVEVDVKIYIN